MQNPVFEIIHQESVKVYSAQHVLVKNSIGSMSVFKKNLNASKPSEHPPQVEECLKV